MKYSQVPLMLLLPALAEAQARFTIEKIDFYGLRTVQEDQVRAYLPFTEGDVPEIDDLGPVANAVAAGLGVPKVEIAGVCCTDSGGAVVYVGVEETPGQSPPYDPLPTGAATLPIQLTNASIALDEAVSAAVRRGESDEDTSQGHSLFEAPEARALQVKFVDFADSNWEELIEVLHESRDGRQRAIAAQIVAYASDKAAVVPHLVRAALDSNEGVRNNATRALSIIATYANKNPAVDIEISPEPFIGMLGSISQTDRNKASILLMHLSERTDPVLMSEIRRRELFSLIEMCHWSWDGHSLPACRILERTLELPVTTPPYGEEDKRKLTEAAMPLLPLDLRAAAERFLRR